MQVHAYRAYIKISLIILLSIAFVFIIYIKYINFCKSLHLLTADATKKIIINKLSSQQQKNNYNNEYKDDICTKFRECKLKNGDVLIRRYITNKTKLVDTIIHPHYTHTAFYVGNGYIVEANGTEEDKTKEIIKEKIIDTDWYRDHFDNWIILRPAYDNVSLSKIDSNLIEIADDTNYTFGIPNDIKDNEHKLTYCSYLIYNELMKNSVINFKNKSNEKDETNNEYISPDYLFYLLISDINTKIVGYSIK